MIYLDHAATTPLAPNVMQIMQDAWENWANAGGQYQAAVRNARKLESLRKDVQNLLQTNMNIIFTASSTEANNIVLNSTRLPIITSKFEHPSIKNWPNVSSIGLEEMDCYLQQNGPHFISIIGIQHETGLIHDIQPILALAKKYYCTVHVDASQAKDIAGFMGADFITISSHKLGGPIGVAAFLAKDQIKPMLYGGGQEHGVRPGTVALPLIAGFVEALNFTYQNHELKAHYKKLKHLLKQLLPTQYFLEHFVQAEFVDHITCLILPGPGSELAAFLDMNDIAVGLGSACSSGAMDGITALSNFANPKLNQVNAIRVSFGWNTTEEDVRIFAARLKEYYLLP